MALRKSAPQIQVDPFTSSLWNNLKTCNPSPLWMWQMFEPNPWLLLVNNRNPRFLSREQGEIQDISVLMNFECPCFSWYLVLLLGRDVNQSIPMESMEFSYSKIINFQDNWYIKHGLYFLTARLIRKGHFIRKFFSESLIKPHCMVKAESICKAHFSLYSTRTFTWLNIVLPFVYFQTHSLRWHWCTFRNQWKRKRRHSKRIHWTLCLTSLSASTSPLSNWTLQASSSQSGITIPRARMTLLVELSLVNTAQERTS